MGLETGVTYIWRQHKDFAHSRMWIPHSRCKWRVTVGTGQGRKPFLTNKTKTNHFDSARCPEAFFWHRLEDLSATEGLFLALYTS